MSETFAKQSRELHGLRLMGYVIGNFGFSMTNILSGVFLFQYYVYTINLDSILVSIGITAQFLLSAFFSIVFGVMADNKKPGRFGKRRPFLIIGLPVWFLSSILIWFPPWYSPQSNSFFFPTAIYFWVIIMTKAISGILITCVHASMLPEQSQTYKNREKVASISTILLIVSSILGMMVPIIIESLLENPAEVKWWEPSGEVLLFYIPLLGAIFAIFGFITLTLTILSVDESFHKDTINNEQKKISLKETFKKMFKPAKESQFRKQLIAEFFIGVSGKTLGLMIIPLMTYVLKFRESDYLLYVIVSIFGKFGGYLVWRKIHERKGLIKTYSLCVGLCVIASLSDLIFLIEFLSFEIKLILFIIIVGTVLGTSYGFGLFSGPLTSALVYETALNVEGVDLITTVSDISGSFYGLLTFLASIGRALTSLAFGLVLTGPNEENSVIITLGFASMGLCYLISFLFLRQIKINDKDMN